MENKKKKWKTLRHYTSVGWLKQILMDDRLKFSNALDQNIEQRWDDQNDIAILRLYYQLYHKNPLVCCFTHSISIHHWEYYGKTYPNRHSYEDELKCCIVFDYDKFLNMVELKKQKGMNLILNGVTYISLNNLKSNAITKKDMPFIKKYGFNVDKEERLVLFVDNEKCEEHFLTGVVNCIKSVTLYVKHEMSEKQIDKVKSELIKIYPKLQGNIHQSALCNSKRWQKQIIRSINNTKNSSL